MASDRHCQFDARVEGTKDDRLPSTAGKSRHGRAVNIRVRVFQQHVEPACHRQVEHTDAAASAQVEHRQLIMRVAGPSQLPHANPFEIHGQHPAFGLIDAANLFVRRLLSGACMSVDVQYGRDFSLQVVRFIEHRGDPQPGQRFVSKFAQLVSLRRVHHVTPYDRRLGVTPRIRRAAKHDFVEDTLPKSCRLLLPGFSARSQLEFGDTGLHEQIHLSAGFTLVQDRFFQSGAERACRVEVDGVLALGCDVHSAVSVHQHLVRDAFAGRHDRLAVLDDDGERRNHTVLVVASHRQRVESSVQDHPQADQSTRIDASGHSLLLSNVKRVWQQSRILSVGILHLLRGDQDASRQLIPIQCLIVRCQFREGIGVDTSDPLNRSANPTDAVPVRGTEHGWSGVTHDGIAVPEIDKGHSRHAHLRACVRYSRLPVNSKPRTYA